MSIIYPGLAFVGAEFAKNICFLGHNFKSRCARKSIKGSKDSDDVLNRKKSLSQKMARWVGTQGQVNSAKRTQKHPIWDVTHREPQTQN